MIGSRCEPDGKDPKPRAPERKEPPSREPRRKEPPQREPERKDPERRGPPAGDPPKDPQQPPPTARPHRSTLCFWHGAAAR